jgi:hypothetical protein
MILQIMLLQKHMINIIMKYILRQILLISVLQAKSVYITKIPDFGVSSFDNFLKAILSVFLYLSYNGRLDSINVLCREELQGHTLMTFTFYLTVIIRDIFHLKFNDSSVIQLSKYVILRIKDRR